MVRLSETPKIEIKDKSDIPCTRKTFYDSDINSYGVCKGVVLPFLVKAALASAATVESTKPSKDLKGQSEEEHDDSLLYAVVAGIFYAFVMVFLILANMHPSKSLLADLERYESLMDAREQKFNARMFARFIKTTEDDNQGHFPSSGQDKRTPSHPSSFANAGETPGDTPANPLKNIPWQQYRTYHSTNTNFKNNHFQL